MLRRLVTAALLLLLLTVVACDDNDNNSPTEPDEPPVEVPTVTETFQGSVPQLGDSAHNFMVANPGTITFSITALSPLETITMGLGVGTPDETDPNVCSQFASDSSVRVGQILQATASVAAAYCVRIFDVGNIFPDQTIEYELTVTHP